jgi:hypothetical protein
MPEIETARVEWAYPQIEENWTAERDVWVEVSESFYWQALGVVPPIKHAGTRFMVGEPHDHNERGAVHTGFVKYGNRCFARQCNVVDFVRLVSELHASLATL